MKTKKEIVEKLLERAKDSSKLIKLAELAILTDVQLYQLYLNNQLYGHTFLIIHSNSYYSNFYSL